MQGNAKVIDYLNQVLKNELTAINQYFLHSRMFKNWGLPKLEDIEHRESIDEMKHADASIERILFLEGLPNLQDIGMLRIGENTKEIFVADLATELDAIPVLRSAIAFCESAGDYISREILTDILESEEEHVDWLDTQVNLIDKMGLENYLSSKV